MPIKYPNDAEYINSTKADVDEFLKNIDTTKKNIMLPEPVKPGEYIICQLCGKPVLPEQIVEDKYYRKRQLKWHLHYECDIAKDNLLDRSTPGLLSERNQRR